MVPSGRGPTVSAAMASMASARPNPLYPPSGPPNGNSAPRTNAAYDELLGLVSNPAISRDASAAVHVAMLSAAVRVGTARNARLSLSTDRTSDLKWVSILILGAMFTLVSRGIFWLLPVSIIAGREILISVYRVVVGARGVSVPASKLAKWKTLFQQLAVGFAIAPLTTTDATWLWVSLLWAAVVLTIITGTQYAYHAVKER